VSRLVAAIILALTATAANAARDVRAFLALRAPIDAPAGELVRLRLPPNLLARAQPDLADLRIVGESGQPVPFVLDSAEDPFGPHAKTLTYRDVEVANVDRTEERRENAPSIWRETYDLTVADLGPADAAWELAMLPHARHFVRHVDVDAVEDDETTRHLAVHAPIFALEGSTHDSFAMATERLSVPLGAIAAHLRVTISGEGDGWVEPSFRLRATRPVPSVARVQVALDVAEQDDAKGVTTLDLTVPGALVPDALHFSTSTGALSRYVEVFTGMSATEATGERVGRGIIARAAPGDPLDPAEVHLRDEDGHRLPPGTDTLRVTIANGDSPALADLVVTALVPVPVLMFVGPTEPAYLYFGGSRVQAAQYDVTNLADVWRASGRAAIAEATVGAVETNPDYDPTPLLEIAMQPASSVDRRLFSHRRALTVPAAPDGLAYVDLDIDDLGVVRPDLADVRVVDATDRQWPYLVDDTPVHRWLTRPLEPLPPGDGWSYHRLPIAATRVPIDRIEIPTPAPVLDREVRLLASDAPGAPIVARGSIGAEPFVTELAGVHYDTLVVAVRDGDERPLPLTDALVRISLPRLDVVAPPGRYTLLLGNADAEPPDYALAGIRRLVDEARGTAATVGVLDRNPVHSATATVFGGAWLQRLGPGIAVWTVLLVGGLGLVLLTLRAVRRGPGAGD
jgi:hypothetical protein